MIDPYLKTSIIALIVVQVILALIVWRRRKLARILIYFEMIGFL